jgi:hypothetical protein
LITKPAFSGSGLVVCESAFLVLFGKMLFAFFGLKQNTVGIAQVFFPALPYSFQSSSAVNAGFQETLD